MNNAASMFGNIVCIHLYLTIPFSEYEEMESAATQQWREAVLSCQTFSRMHMLVGMFDSCIKWEKSIATKVRRLLLSVLFDHLFLYLC